MTASPSDTPWYGDYMPDPKPTASPSASAGEILACPWCGPDGAAECGYADMGMSRFAVECRKCLAEGPTLADRVAAISAWNAVAALRGRVGDLEMMLRHSLAELRDNHAAYVLWSKDENAWKFGTSGDDGRGYSLALADDGTGLPILTDAARRALGENSGG